MAKKDNRALILIVIVIGLLIFMGKEPKGEDEIMSFKGAGMTQSIIDKDSKSKCLSSRNMADDYDCVGICVKVDDDIISCWEEHGSGLIYADKGDWAYYRDRNEDCDEVIDRGSQQYECLYGLIDCISFGCIGKDCRDDGCLDSLACNENTGDCEGESEVTHLECVDKVCTMVDGEGTDTCSPEGDSCVVYVKHKYNDCVKMGDGKYDVYWFDSDDERNDVFIKDGQKWINCDTCEKDETIKAKGCDKPKCNIIGTETVIINRDGIWECQDGTECIIKSYQYEGYLEFGGVSYKQKDLPFEMDKGDAAICHGTLIGTKPMTHCSFTVNYCGVPEEEEEEEEEVPTGCQLHLSDTTCEADEDCMWDEDKSKCVKKEFDWMLVLYIMGGFMVFMMMMKVMSKKQ